MRQTRYWLPALVVLALFLNYGRAQTGRGKQAQPDLGIGIGTPVSVAQDVLARAGVGPGGLKAFAAPRNGDKFLFYTLERNRIDLVLRYSQESGRIASISLFYLGTPRAKSNEVSVGAKSIVFHADATYSVRFIRLPDVPQKTLPSVRPPFPGR